MVVFRAWRRASLEARYAPYELPGQGEEVMSIWRMKKRLSAFSGGNGPRA
jgi:hypothetical protein